MNLVDVRLMEKTSIFIRFVSLRCMQLKPIFFLLFMLSLVSCNRQSDELSEKVETIEVSYVNWACNCADFIETGYSEKEIKEENCIYLEAADPRQTIPSGYFSGGHFTHKLRLTGQFYKKSGVSKDYEPKTEGTSEPARVFRYTQVEWIKKKDSTKTQNKVEQVVFGLFCGECAGHCATMYRYDGATMMVDYTDSYFKGDSKMVFETPLSGESYQEIGEQVISNIPESMLKSVIRSRRYGCPDCTDGCGIYFEFTKNGMTRRFAIDRFSTELPSEIRTFVDFLQQQLRELPGNG